MFKDIHLIIKEHYKKNDPHIIFLICIILTGVFLRFLDLNKNFWLDEFLTIKEDSKIIFFSRESAIGLNPYSVSIYFILKIFGINELVLRIFSVVFGILTIIATYFIGKHLFDKKIGLLGAALLSLFPLAIILSQEVRMYSMLSFFSTIQLFLFAKVSLDILAPKRSSIKLYLAYSLLTLLVLFIHFSAAVLLSSELIVFGILFFVRKIPLSRYFPIMLSIIIPSLLFLYWFFNIIISKFTFLSSSNNFIEVYVKTNSAINNITGLILGISIGTFSMGYINYILAIFIVALPLVSIFSRLENRKNLPELLILAGTIYIFVFLSLFIKTYVPRHYFIILPYISLLIAIFLTDIYNTNKLSAHLLAISILVISGFNATDSKLADEELSGRKWNLLTERISSLQNNNSSAIFVPMPQLNDIFRYYYRGNLPIIDLNEDSRFINNPLIKNNEIGVPFVDNKLAESLASSAKKYKKIFFIYEGSLPLGDPQDLIRTNLKKYFIRTNTECFPPEKKELCIISYQGIN